MTDLLPDTGQAPDLATRSELIVSSVSLVAENIVAIELRDPEGDELPPWEPGAHIDLVLPSGNVRPYSLCGDTADLTSYRIAVLREAKSRGGSEEIHDTGLVGKRVGVRGPKNRFVLEPAERYLFIAGGIGITPILAMVKKVSGEGTPWRLVYGGRTRRSLGFLDELDACPGGNVTVIPEDVDGRPDIRALFEDLDADAAVYCCGPAPMLEAAERVAEEVLAPGALHVERFAGTDAPPRDDTDAETFEVELARTGLTLPVPPDRSILDVVLDVVPGQLYSCEEGYCGTCETRVLSGEPEHRDTVLTDEERRDRMMICVGRSRSAKLVLDL